MYVKVGLNVSPNQKEKIIQAFQNKTGLTLNFNFNISSRCELEIKINKELSRVSQWMSKNCLIINPSK